MPAWSQLSPVRGSYLMKAVERGLEVQGGVGVEGERLYKNLTR